MLTLLALVLTSTGASVELPQVDLVPPGLELAPVRSPTIPGGPRLVVEEPPLERTTARYATLVGSAASVATGIALTIWGAILASDAETFFACVPGCDDVGQWLRMFDRSLDGEISGTGPAVVPLGLSLIGAGTVTGVGTELVEEEGDVPWVSIVAGVVVGAAMYGAMEAMEGRAP